MDGRLRDETVYAGDDARHRFFDSRGYGRSLTAPERDEWGSSGVALSRVEAAHLLARGDLDAVRADGRRLDFRAFLADAADSGVLLRYLVYADLRERGFYLSPARDGWPNTAGWDADGVDFVVYPRGNGPSDGEIGYRVRVVGERTPVAVADLPGVLAVVDEESDVTYLGVDRPDLAGDTVAVPATAGGVLLADRAVLWDPPAALYHEAFYGQPLPGREPEAALQLSLVEAAHLAGHGAVDLDARDGDGESADETDGTLPPVGAYADPAASYGATVARGRAVEGERFDRRLRTYAALRDRGLVPKTGFKFGADYRTYADFDGVDDLSHSELLFRVLPGDATRTPRDLALDVRLAHGVRKRMVFALVDRAVEYRVVERMTP